MGRLGDRLSNFIVDNEIGQGLLLVVGYFSTIALATGAAYFINKCLAPEVTVRKTGRYEGHPLDNFDNAYIDRCA